MWRSGVFSAFKGLLPMAFLFPTLSKIVKTMVIVAVLNWSSMESTAKSAQKETLGGELALLLPWVLLAWRCSLTLMSSGFTTQLKMFVCFTFLHFLQRSNGKKIQSWSQLQFDWKNTQKIKMEGTWGISRRDRIQLWYDKNF